MRVVKRSGRIEDMRFDNITNRIKNLTYGLSENCDSSKVAQQVASSLYDGITVQEIDTLSAEICVGMITVDPDYEILATRITASNIQKVCPNNFHNAMKKLAKAGIVTEEVARVAGRVRDDIDTKRDYDFGYFGLKTLEKSYLQRLDGVLMETPQYMFMRVAIGIHGEDIPSVLETYDKMSKGFSFMQHQHSSMQVHQDHKCQVAFSSPTRKILLMEFMVPSPNVHKSVSGREGLVCIFMM